MGLGLGLGLRLGVPVVIPCFESKRLDMPGERHVVAAVEVEAVGKAVEAAAGGLSLVWMAVEAVVAVVACASSMAW